MAQGWLRKAVCKSIALEQVREGCKYVHNTYNGQFDWFMRIDDDGFVIMENLMLFLHQRDPTKPGSCDSMKTPNDAISQKCTACITKFWTAMWEQAPD